MTVEKIVVTVSVMVSLSRLNSKVVWTRKQRNAKTGKVEHKKWWPDNEYMEIIIFFLFKASNDMAGVLRSLSWRKQKRNSLKTMS